MNFKREIEFYGEDLQDFEMSPFEMIETFHRRTLLHDHYNELTTTEKALLKEIDQLLLKTANKIYEHLKNIYDFQNDKPLEEWWWHLDKVVNHQLSVDLDQGNIQGNHFFQQLLSLNRRKHTIFFWIGHVINRLLSERRIMEIKKLYKFCKQTDPLQP